MVATENGLIYIALLGDPLRNLMTVRHFFGDNFKVHDEKVLIQVGQIFNAHLKLWEGVYQTYHEINGRLFEWKLLSIYWTGTVYKLDIDRELWCAKEPILEHAYFPDENSRVLFEKYFGIR
jgi:hypothetical protein